MREREREEREREGERTGKAPSEKRREKGAKIGRREM